MISSRELDIMSQFVFSDAALTPMDLSELTGQSKSAVSRLIENLDSKGFVTKQYNSKDKRSYTLNITEKETRNWNEPIDIIWNRFMNFVESLEKNALNL